MPATYYEARLTLNPDFNEIVMAELGQIGYESFVETDEGLLACIIDEQFDAALRCFGCKNYCTTPAQNH